MRNPRANSPADTLRSQLGDVAAPFDEELADRIVRSNDEAVFLAALGRKDCPAALTVDLSQARDSEVRLAVAGHPNTPDVTLRRMTGDTDPDVSRAATRRVR